MNLKPRNAVKGTPCKAVNRWCWRLAPWGVASGRRRSKGALLLLPNLLPNSQSNIQVLSTQSAFAFLELPHPQVKKIN
jgi:hypothetical protein